MIMPCVILSWKLKSFEVFKEWDYLSLLQSPKSDHQREEDEEELIFLATILAKLEELKKSLIVVSSPRNRNGDWGLVESCRYQWNDLEVSEASLRGKHALH